MQQHDAEFMRYRLVKMSMEKAETMAEIFKTQKQISLIDI